MLIESSTVIPCGPFLLWSFRCGQARQDQGLAAVHEVAAVELGADLDRQVAVL